MPPPQPYRDRHTLLPFEPALLSDACYARMCVLLRAVKKMSDGFDVSIDDGHHLTEDDDNTPLFPLGTSASTIVALLPFPIEHLAMYICIVSGDLQADAAGLAAGSLYVHASAGNLVVRSALTSPWRPQREPR